MAGAGQRMGAGRDCVVLRLSFDDLGRVWSWKEALQLKGRQGRQGRLNVNKAVGQFSWGPLRRDGSLYL